MTTEEQAAADAAAAEAAAAAAAAAAAEGTIGSMKAADLAKMINDGITTHLNAFDKKIKTELDKLRPAPAKTQAEKDAEAAAAARRAAAPGVGDLYAAENEELKTRLAAIETERASEKKEAAQGQIKSELKLQLSGFQWSEGGADVAFDFFLPKVTRGENGELMVGDNSASKYIKEFIPRGPLKGLLAPRQVGGAGADKGTPGAAVGGKQVQLEDIKPGASPETFAAAAAAIIAAKASLNQ